MTREEEIKKAAQAYISGDTLSIQYLMHFENGAGWADEHPNLESIWHDASEKPGAKEWLLIQFGEDDYDVLSLDDLYIDMWCTWCKTYNVIRWAYVDDLLPKQFGNSEQLKGGER